MSLTATVQKSVNQAFDALGDLAGDFTLRKVQTTFDPATSTSTVVTADTIGKGVLDNSEVQYMEAQTMTNQYVTLWLKVAVEPEMGDLILDPSGNINTILMINAIKTNITDFIYEIRLAV